MTPARPAGTRVLIAHRGRAGAHDAEWARRAGRQLRRAARRAGLQSTHELSLLLCDGATIRRLNRRWRGHDRTTDVLSFPLHTLREGELPPPGAVGDIVVSLPAVRRAARELAVPPAAHLERLLVHGLMHLLGYDHERTAQARRMEAAERRLLETEERP